MQEINEHDFNDGDGHSPYNQRRIEKEREKVWGIASQSSFVCFSFSIRHLIYNQHLQKKQKKKFVKLQVCFNRNTFFSK
jgi:hypothetical protein